MEHGQSRIKTAAPRAMASWTRHASKVPRGVALDRNNSCGERDERGRLGKVVGQALLAAALVDIAQAQQLRGGATGLAIAAAIGRRQLTPREQFGGGLSGGGDGRGAGGGVGQHRCQVHHH
eukprot:scaffold1342_cov120-Isochrysis_galbana.AAC.6